MSSDVFALDINEKFTRIASLQLNKGKIELLSLGYDETTANFFSNPNEKTSADQSKVISTLATQLKLPQKKVYAVMPDGVTYSQLMVMPQLKEEELVNAIRLQADEFVPLPINEVYIDLEVIDTLPNNKLLVLFVASPKKIVDHISDTISLAGFEPVALENEISAMGRFVSEVYRTISNPSLIINFGYSGSSIYFINPPFPFFEISRSTRIGLDILLKDLRVNLNLQEHQAIEALQSIGLQSGYSLNIYPIVYAVVSELFTEIEKTILLAKERYNATIKNLYLYNFDSSVAGLYQTLQTKFSMPVQPFPISDALVANKITQTFQPQLSTFISVIAAHLR